MNAEELKFVQSLTTEEIWCFLSQYATHYITEHTTTFDVEGAVLPTLKTWLENYRHGEQVKRQEALDNLKEAINSAFTDGMSPQEFHQFIDEYAKT